MSRVWVFTKWFYTARGAFDLYGCYSTAKVIDLASTIFLANLIFFVWVADGMSESGSAIRSEIDVQVLFRFKVSQMNRLNVTGTVPAKLSVSVVASS